MTAEAGEAPAVEITVDGAAMAAEPGELLIEACERNGVYIPRFCYHPRMTSVGMCRMCLVTVDTGRGPSLQPSCMVTVAENMAVETESAAAVKAQNGVLEFLLINHPLDCPVCDKGGECPLQDQTMSYGPGESRFVEEKRHFEKPIAISATVHLDRERCILCDRCTRFADEVAGDPLISFMGRGGATEVNTFAGEHFASYFSGNTVQICPVGALTADPYRFKARPWDLTEAVSTAWVDSVGARVSVQSSRNRVLRVQGVDADEVNWGWLTDKERFAFEALDSDGRLTGPLVRDGGGTLAPASWADAAARVAEALGGAPAERVAVLGGARLTNESQYAWAKLAKGVIGTDNVDAQLDDGLPPELVLSLPRATIDEVCRPGGVIVLLAGDPKEELGSLYLRLRHAVARDGAVLIEITPRATGLSALAAHSLHPRPGETAELVRALLAAAEAGSADGGAAGCDRAAIAAAAAALDGEITVVLGRGSLAEAADSVAAAAALLAERGSVRFLPVLRRGNVNGALDAGLAPGLAPGRALLADAADRLAQIWPRVPARPGLDARAALKAASVGEIDVLVLLGADPLNDFCDRAAAGNALEGAATVIAVDLFVNDSAARAADVVLAAAGPTETEGAFTNIEGRVSPMAQKVTPPGTARADWMIAADLARRLGADLGFASLAEIRSEMAEASELHRALTEEALAASPVEGVVLAGTQIPVPAVEAPFSPGSRELRLVATRAMYDDGVMLRHCPSSRGLARGPEARVNPAALFRIDAQPSATVRVSSARGHIDAPLVVDEGVPPGAVAVEWLAPGAPANALIEAGSPVTEVTVEAR